ncbi:hypothetical protein ABEB36_009419 [Hypothenemus hampei]|uniref:Uncharacterized protein n=1 Tax=Hypothenemus hampei TaxID=57062 RepID=A0ABD1EGA2_HYPHA
MMVVRDGKATFVEETGVEDPFKNWSLEGDTKEERIRVVLNEDIDIRPFFTQMVNVGVENLEGDGEVIMQAKLISTGMCNVVIPGGVLASMGGKAQVKIENLGPSRLQWKKGRIIARADRCQHVQVQRQENVIQEGRL